MKENNVLVIGGSGFLGKGVIKSLQKRDFNITIFDLYDPKINNTKFIKGDITSQKDISKLETYDYVFNLAAIADLHQANKDFHKTIDVNLVGTLNVLRYLEKNTPKRFLFSSTMYVFGDLGGVYGTTKRASELLIKQFSDNFDIKFTFLRYGSLYGFASQEWNSIHNYVSEIFYKKKITHWGTGNEIREYINIDDAADLSVDCMLDSEFENEAATITGTQKFTSKEVLELIFEMLDLEPNINFENKTGGFHYKYSSYSHNFPLSGKKVLPKTHTDLGQGIFNLVRDLKLKK